MRVAILSAFVVLASCSSEPTNSPSMEIEGFDQLVDQVEQRKIGYSADQWIEMHNDAGEWERVGLIFGYVDDYEECVKAIGGLKKVNFAREYRCVPANKSE